MMSTKVRSGLRIKPEQVWTLRSRPTLLDEVSLCQNPSRRRRASRLAQRLSPWLAVKNVKPPPPPRKTKPQPKLPKQPVSIPEVALSAPTQRSSNRSHDLLLAVAELGALEQRIGYRFSDKLLGVSAFKTSNDATTVNFEGTKKEMMIEDHKRLALLGDRVLDLALCRNWYETRQSREQYAKREARLVTRVALGQMSRKINLVRNVLTDRPSLATDTLGEAFEALVGAIYLDSGDDLGTVRRVLHNIGFAAVETAPEIAIAATSQPEMETEPSSQSTSSSQPASATADIIQSNGDAEPDFGAAKRSRKVIQSQIDPPLKQIPHISTIHVDLTRIFSDSTRHLRRGSNVAILEAQVFGALYRYYADCEDIIDLCSWFPDLETRYARLLDLDPGEGIDILKPRNGGRRRIHAFFSSLFVPDEVEKGQDDRRIWRNTVHSNLHAQFIKVTGMNISSVRVGNVSAVLRHAQGLGARDAFLTACRIEEQTRDSLRKAMGLPDWYHLPENKDKVLPPWKGSGASQTDAGKIGTFAQWRTTEPVCSPVQDAALLAEEPVIDLPPKPCSHADTIIPMEVQHPGEPAIRPPLLLDTARRPEPELNAPPAGVEQSAKSPPIEFAWKTDAERQLSPAAPSPSPAVTKSHRSPATKRSVKSPQPRPKSHAHSSMRRKGRVGDVSHYCSSYDPLLGVGHVH